MKKIVLLFVMGILLFSCRPEDNPSVSTGEVTDITSTTASCAGNVTADGGAAIIARGVCWSTTQFPTISDSKTSNGTGLGVFTGNITGLAPYTTYYVMAYATNAKGTAYGEQKVFTTKQEMPTVATGEVTNITATTADCSGNVTSDGGSSVTDRGVCWSTSENPTTSNSKTTDGTGMGTYTSNITGLSPYITYYVRAYATNTKGTAYGEQEVFTTNQGMPTVVTGEVTNITATTTICDGTVTADGGSSVTARGVCWSTKENPTIDNNKTSNGTGTGTFTSNLTSLSTNTTYYVRAYATNSEGTAYGEGKSFTTLYVDIEYSSFTDSRDDKVYKTVTIGDQVWMAENLAYLPSVVDRDTGSEDTGHETDPYYYVYGYNGTDVEEAKRYEYSHPLGLFSIKTYEIYGVLYNWPAAMNGASSSNTKPSEVQGICPKGWHLPSVAEWTILTDYLGGEDIAGGKMKVTGTTLWEVPNQGATNESGFTALPGGYRSSASGVETGPYSFDSVGSISIWWSSTEYENYTNGAWILSLLYSRSKVNRTFVGKAYGCSVRCLKD